MAGKREIGRGKMVDLLFIRKVLLMGCLLVGIAAAPAWSQQVGDPDANASLAKVGAYTETHVDLSVAVDGGNIQLRRVWDGAYARWQWNPHQGPLVYDRGFQWRESITRGTIAYKCDDKGVCSRTGVRTADSVPASVNDLIAKGQVQSCSGKDKWTEDMIFVITEPNATGNEVIQRATGFRWAHLGNREWAEYNLDGNITRWGIGSRVTGKALYEQVGKVVRLKGYADRHDREVISYEYAPDGRIVGAHDYSGRRVSYELYPTDDGNKRNYIKQATDADGIKTGYEYTNTVRGQISRRTIGEFTGGSEQDRNDNFVGMNFTYNKYDWLESMVRDDGVGTYVKIEYDEASETWMHTYTLPGDRVVKKLLGKDGRLRREELNGAVLRRQIPICEDYVNIDRSNRPALFDFDAYGRPIGVVYSNGGWRKIQYYTQGWAEASKGPEFGSTVWGEKLITESVKTRVELERDELGDLTEIAVVGVDGKKLRKIYSYDSEGRLLEKRVTYASLGTQESDSVERWAYDMYGAATTFINPENASYAYSYDSLGRVRRMVDPLSREFKISYGPRGQRAVIEGPNNYRFQRSFSNRGLVLLESTTIEKDGPITTYSFHYNSAGDAIILVDGLGGQWSYEYNHQGLPVRTSDSEGNVLTTSYDPYGRIVSQDDGSGFPISIEYFDTAVPGEPSQEDTAFSRMVRSNRPTLTVETRYDYLDRVVQNSIRSVSGEVQTFRFEYNDLGYVSKTVAADGKASSRDYDGLGRLVKVSSPGWGNTTYEYFDAENRVITRDPLGGVIEEVYDRLGRVVLKKHPEGILEQRKYDDLGRVIWYFNAKKEAKHLIYNLDGNLEAEEWYSDSEDLRNYRKRVVYERNLRGDLLAYSDGETSGRYSYDLLGRLKVATVDYGAFVKSESFDYYKNGNLRRFTSADGIDYFYEWDNSARLSSIRIADEGLIGFRYKPEYAENISEISFPGGVKRHYEYDDLLRLKRIRVEGSDSGASPLMDFQYGYLNGSAINSIATQHGLYSYSYDEADRVIRAEGPDQPSQEYSYNFRGDRQPLFGTPWEYNSNGGLIRANGVDYAYDAQGNRISEGDIRNIYDEANRLTRVEDRSGEKIAEYGYSPFGERLWKEVGRVKTYFYYNKSGLSAEFDERGNAIRSYLYVPNSPWSTSPLAMRDRAGFHYFQTDHLGTPRMIHSKLGTVEWSAEYEAYGKAHIRGTPTLVNPLRFPGQYFDTETGRHQNYMRDYDPESGGYLEADPVSLIMGGRSSSEGGMYGYVKGGPSWAIDPMGLETLSPRAVEAIRDSIAKSRGNEGRSEDEIRRELEGIEHIRGDRPQECGQGSGCSYRCEDGKVCIWLEPNPRKRYDDLSSGKGDFSTATGVSLLAHEVYHCTGYSGNRPFLAPPAKDPKSQCRSAEEAAAGLTGCVAGCNYQGNPNGCVDSCVKGDKKWCKLAGVPEDEYGVDGY